MSPCNSSEETKKAPQNAEANMAIYNVSHLKIFNLVDFSEIKAFLTFVVIKKGKGERK